MFKAYIGTKIIQAEPQDKDGIHGYTVIYPDGYASWCPKETFENANREISFHERQIIEMTDAEAQVSAISDGGCEHFWEYQVAEDDDRCTKCKIWHREIDPKPR